MCAGPATRWTCGGEQGLLGQVQGRTADDAAYWLALAPRPGRAVSRSSASTCAASTPRRCGGRQGSRGRAADLLVRGVTGLERAAAGLCLTLRAATAAGGRAGYRVGSLARLCGARRGCKHVKCIPGRSGQGFVPSQDLAPLIWAAAMALVIPAAAALALPRQFGIALLAGWICDGASMVAFYTGLPGGVFGFTLLALVLLIIPFAGVAQPSGIQPGLRKLAGIGLSSDCVSCSCAGCGAGLAVVAACAGDADPALLVQRVAEPLGLAGLELGEAGRRPGAHPAAGSPSPRARCETVPQRGHALAAS
jgi:hypothetical protein